MNKFYKLLLVLLAFSPFASRAQDSCAANFTVSPNSSAFTKIYTAQPWHNNNKPVTQICWNFGDGTDTCINAVPGTVPPLSISHTYTQSNIYNVCVKITYQGGCIADRCNVVTVGSNTQPDSCRADFNVFSTAGAPLVRQFSPLPWHNNNKPVTEVKWTFGDGSQLITTSPVLVTHTYAQPGTYNVCVRIVYDGGCVAEKCKTVIIQSNTQPDSCRADFNVFSTSGAPLVRQFTPLPWHNNNKPVTEVKWTFGDGSQLITTTPVSVTHTYAQPGTYNVCVRIVYDGGCVAEKCKTVIIQTNIQPDSCIADFQVYDSLPPFSKTFVPIFGHNNNKPIIEVRWTFGDNSPPVVNTAPTSVNHIFPGPGTYTVCIRIKYDGGCIAEKCKAVVVNNPLPDSCAANFEVLQTSATGLTRTFIAQPWHSNQKPPVQICWKFGDGHDTCLNASAGALPPLTITHTYAQPGTYNVCVKITYQGGCIAEKCKTVTVVPIIPPDSCRADFETTSFSSTPLMKKYTAIPWHNNNKKPEKICWTFGDGTDTCITYNPANPNNQYFVYHAYAQSGIYTVCVKIKYQGGCEAQLCRPVPVGVNTQPDSCRAQFSVETIQNTGLLRRFNAIPWHSTGKRPERICWQFGDGRDTCINYNPAVSTLYSVIHQYLQPGTYNVCVKIRYQGGCEAQYCRPVVVALIPCRAEFSDSMISRFKVKFKGNAIVAQPNNPVISWQWTFGDGTSGTGQNVIHEYAQPGAYTVCLKITTANGCQHTLCKVKVIDSGVHILQLHPNPVINTLYITYFSFRNELAQIKIYNMFGIMVRSFTRQMTIGYNNFSTDVSTLPPGPYSLVVQTPTTTAASVFFKQ